MLRRKMVFLSVLPFLAFGTADGEPSAALVKAREHFRDADINAVSFRNAEAFFETEAVNAGEHLVLERGIRPVDPAVTIGGELLSFDEALAKTYTNALLVLHRGELIDERYFNGASADDRFIAWSISKSITSVLVGIALERGDIKGLDDPASRYLPFVESTAFDGATVRDLLTMRAGTNYRESQGEPPTHVEILRAQSVERNERRFYDYSTLGLERVAPAGSVFNYSTLTTGLLAELLERATGRRLAELTETDLWRPAGMQDDAYWILDGVPPEGDAVGGGGFNASARDLARFGMLMLNDGRAGRRQVVPEDWVRESTKAVNDEVVIPPSGRGYGYQWWVRVGTGQFSAIGVFGQIVSVDRDTESVIVKLSHWPEKGGSALGTAHVALLDAIRAELADRM